MQEVYSKNIQGTAEKSVILLDWTGTLDNPEIGIMF